MVGAAIYFGRAGGLMPHRFFGKRLLGSAADGFDPNIGSAGVVLGDVPATHKGEKPATPRHGIGELPVTRLLSVTDFGRRTWRERHRLRAPVDVIVTTTDNVADHRQSLQVAKETGGAALIFDASEKVPHALLAPFENPNAAAVQRTADFIVERLVAT